MASGHEKNGLEVGKIGVCKTTSQTNGDRLYEVWQSCHPSQETHRIPEIRF